MKTMIIYITHICVCDVASGQRGSPSVFHVASALVGHWGWRIQMDLEDHLHGWQVGAGFLPRAVLASAQHGGWVPEGSIEREPGGSCVTFKI